MTSSLMEDVSLYERRRLRFFDQLKEEKSKPGFRNQGFLYLARGEENITKIGKTRNDPYKRVRDIHNMMWLDVKLLYVSIIYWDLASAEHLLHKTFAKERRKSEWFNLSAKEIYDFTHDQLKGLYWEEYDEYKDYKSLEKVFYESKLERDRRIYEIENEEYLKLNLTKAD